MERNIRKFFCLNRLIGLLHLLLFWSAHTVMMITITKTRATKKIKVIIKPINPITRKTMIHTMMTMLIINTMIISTMTIKRRTTMLMVMMMITIMVIPKNLPISGNFAVITIGSQYLSNWFIFRNGNFGGYKKSYSDYDHKDYDDYDSYYRKKRQYDYQSETEVKAVPNTIISIQPTIESKNISLKFSFSVLLNFSGSIVCWKSRWCECSASHWLDQIHRMSLSKQARNYGLPRRFDLRC